MAATRNVAVLLFPDVELLDFAGPFEVFTTASRWSDPPAFHVYTVAEKLEPVAARNGLSVNPHFLLETCPPPDLLVVPGGLGTRKEMNNEALVDWIGQAAAKAEVVLSVGTGALLLAKAGVLDNLEATTHHGAIDLLRQEAPKATIREGVRFVDNGKVVTSAGIATGIDAALHVVGRLLGQEQAEKTARHMEYPWPSRSGAILGVHHVQLTVPKGAEDEARRFYCQTLGLPEVEKPTSLQARGGLWLQVGDRQVHIGVEDGVNRLATKVHIAYEVHDLSGWKKKLAALGIEIIEGVPIAGYDRFEFRDPFGNRVEFLQRR
jgi:putative intracellular protease/amidase/catechol 2,3-dioxygenase-like lactoylglutathione lyase family enzyme